MPAACSAPSAEVYKQVSLDTRDAAKGVPGLDRLRQLAMSCSKAECVNAPIVKIAGSFCANVCVSKKLEVVRKKLAHALSSGMRDVLRTELHAAPHSLNPGRKHMIPNPAKYYRDDAQVAACHIEEYKPITMGDRLSIANYYVYLVFFQMRANLSFGYPTGGDCAPSLATAIVDTYERLSGSTRGDFSRARLFLLGRAFSDRLRLGRKNQSG